MRDNWLRMREGLSKLVFISIPRTKKSMVLSKIWQDLDCILKHCCYMGSEVCYTDIFDRWSANSHRRRDIAAQTSKNEPENGKKRCYPDDDVSQMSLPPHVCHEDKQTEQITWRHSTLDGNLQYAN